MGMEVIRRTREKWIRFQRLFIFFVSLMSISVYLCIPWGLAYFLLSLFREPPRGPPQWKALTIAFQIEYLWFLSHYLSQAI